MVCGVVKRVFGRPVVIIDGKQDLEAVTASALDFIKKTKGKGSDDGNRTH
jgi:hypothetical protein